MVGRWAGQESVAGSTGLLGELPDAGADPARVAPVQLHVGAQVRVSLLARAAVKAARSSKRCTAAAGTSPGCTQGP